jgi:hypothetical protein
LFIRFPAGTTSFAFLNFSLFYSKAKGAGESAATGKGGGKDGVVQLPAERDLEMVFDMAAAAYAVCYR